MLANKSHIERARFAETVLAIFGGVIIIIGVNARWLAVHYPILIYIAVIISIAILATLGYFIAHLVIHLKQFRSEKGNPSLFTVPLRVLSIILIISTILDAVYATAENSWNQYSIAIVVGLLLGVAAIPFHIVHSEYAGRKVE